MGKGHPEEGTDADEGGLMEVFLGEERARVVVVYLEVLSFLGRR